MRVDGSWHCGKITCEAEVDAKAFSLFVPVAKENFRLRGEPRIYVKTGESGNRRAQAFCQDCGFNPAYRHGTAAGGARAADAALVPLGVALGARAFVGPAAREDQGFWVADTGGVVGMVGIEHRDDETAELRRMAVEKAQRRKGIARELLATAEAFTESRGYRRIVLSTSELQVAARQLYESSGYRLVREEKNAAASRKSAGAGLTRHHYEKSLR